MSDPRLSQSGRDAQAAHVIEEIGETVGPFGDLLAALGKTGRWDGQRQSAFADGRSRDEPRLGPPRADCRQARNRRPPPSHRALGNYLGRGAL